VTEAGFIEFGWRDEGDGTGELFVVAESATGFRGSTSAWLDRANLTTFADCAAQYPLDTARLPEMSGRSTPFGGSPMVQVGLKVYPVGGKGQIGISVELARKPWTWPTMRPEEQHRVVLEVLTTYPRLAELSDGLQHLLTGEISSARIDGEVLD
jgi:hypothetical protein